MKIKKITIHHMKMQMKTPFTTSFGTVQDKEFLLLQAVDEQGTIGWGESVAFEAPWYTEETRKMNWHVLEDFIIPLILNKEITHPDEITHLLSGIRRNNMAKATIEGAIWDIYAQQTKQSLAKAIGGVKEKIEVGVSIGIQSSNDKLIEVVGQYLQQGYKRIKIKIKPGYDIEPVRILRETFPEIQLMVDANSAYTLQNIDVLKQLDPYNLLMIEQPLAHDDIIDHAILQRQIQTPICLDESICSLEDARKAVELGSCKVINIKIGRVGGISEAKKIHDYCEQHGIPVWCGGMLESGIGRAHNVALTSLSNFVIPGDTSGSNRYWHEDIIEPEVISENGYIHVPTEIGTGHTPNVKLIKKYTIAKKTY